jgi:hypothetical protein
MPDQIAALLLAVPYVVIFGIPSASIAAKKGFAWYAWPLAFGAIGLVVVFLLPSATDSPTAEGASARRNIGNAIGSVLSIAFLLTVAIVLVSSPS